MLVDRRTERSALDSLIASARGGLGSALVLRGEPGIGKTALLEYAIESAAGFRVARAGSVESEMELAYAALHQVCGPMLGWLERLPGPQRDALGVAFGLRAGEAPDRFLVGLAVLNLLSEVAGERPLLCVVDDAQWLDRASAQALAFAARRLLAEPAALIFATREPAGEFTGLPEQLVQGLGDTDARALLGSFLRVPLDEQVCDQIVAETWGNPLALLELPRGLTPEDLAGGFGVLGAPGLPGRIEESFLRRCQALPAAVRQLLLVAAAEPAGDPVLVWRAAGRLGIPRDAAAAAEAEELLVTGARVMFRHPLVRSAVYRAASPQERRAVHEALAEVTDPEADPDRRAWHLAEAALGPDEEVAAELERSAGRAQARGGVAAAAAFLDRAVALTLDPAQRADRALAAADAKYQAGAFDAALGLLATAEGDRPPRTRRPAHRAGPRPPALRRVAAPPAPPGRCPRTASRGVPDLRLSRRRGVRGAGPDRTARDGRAGAQAHRAEARSPDRAGSAYRPPGRRGCLQPRDRRAAVHQPGDRRLPPAEGIRHARHQLPQPAPHRAARTARLTPAAWRSR